VIRKKKRQTAGFAMTEGWIPAFAGMTDEDFTLPPQGGGDV